MSEMDEAIYNSKPAIPNKLLNEDGTITTINGDTATDAVTEYKSKPALPNKFLNPDGSYSTLGEIISGMVDTSIFVIVDELPASGDPQKIYLVPDGKGGFTEYHWTGTDWDIIGAISAEMTPQVFTWAIALPKTQTTISSASDIELWTEIVEASKVNNCLVVCTNVSSLNTDIIVFDIAKNSLVKSNSQINVLTNMFRTVEYKTNFGFTSVYRILYRVELYYTDDAITSIKWTPAGSMMSEFDVVSANSNYNVSYTPQYNGSPATKKYVDDAISTNITQAIGGSY